MTKKEPGNTWKVNVRMDAEERDTQYTVFPGWVIVVDGKKCQYFFQSDGIIRAGSSCVHAITIQFTNTAQELEISYQ